MEPAYTPPPLQSASFFKIFVLLLRPFLPRSFSFSLSSLFPSSLSLSLFRFPPLFSLARLLANSLFFPLLYLVSPSIGSGIPSCECKIDGASRDNCCSGTRFQTRIHLEYARRKALPVVRNGQEEVRPMGGRKVGRVAIVRKRSDFSFVKRFFGHDTVCYRSPIQRLARSAGVL